MRPAPSLGHVARYPVTAGLAILAIGVTIAWHADRVNVDVVTLDVRAFLGEPWRLLTSVFPHVDVFHLLFNIYWLWVFGTLLEDVFGHLRTLLTMALFAVGSGAAEYALFADGGVGLSGVGYGLFGMTWWLARRDPRFFDAMDRRTAVLFAGWFLLCILLTAGGWMPVANVAHGMGWAQGLAAGAVVTSTGGGRLGVGLASLGLVAASLVGATVARPAINLSPDAGRDSARLGYLALESNDDESAVEHLERALELGDQPRWWHNLGIAYERVGRYEASALAFERAGTLRPPGA